MILLSDEVKSALIELVSCQRKVEAASMFLNRQNLHDAMHYRDVAVRNLVALLPEEIMGQLPKL